MSSLDIVAIVWFGLCWGGYSWLSIQGRYAQYGLVWVTNQHRLAWAHALLGRENRVPDAALVGNLIRHVSFYASTTIYILAGLLALMTTAEKVISFTAELPFAGATSRGLWEIKLLLLLGIFVFAYFKFTWSLRQFNFVSILIGGAPLHFSAPAQATQCAQRLARVNSLAGEAFNRGVHAYYFGLAAASWFIHPWAFLLSSTAITWVLYRRDFSSAVLAAMRDTDETR